MAQQGILIVISGPSGTGKGTICQELLRGNPNLNYSISATTRAPRVGEIDGVNYLFTGKDQFKSMIENNELLEWAEVYGNFYGTPRRYVLDQLNAGQDVVLEIDTQGAIKVKNNFPEGIYIYILPPSLEELADRIHKRGTDSLEVIKKRLSCASSELDCARKYHYLVVNDEVPKAVQKVEAIIMAEKCRAERNYDLVENICRASCAQEI